MHQLILHRVEQERNKRIYTGKFYFIISQGHTKVTPRSHHYSQTNNITMKSVYLEPWEFWHLSNPAKCSNPIYLCKLRNKTCLFQYLSDQYIVHHMQIRQITLYRKHIVLTCMHALHIKVSDTWLPILPNALFNLVILSNLTTNIMFFWILLWSSEYCHLVFIVFNSFCMFFMVSITIFLIATSSSVTMLQTKVCI